MKTITMSNRNGDAMATILIVTDRGLIALGPLHTGKQFVAEELDNGDILLRRNSTFTVDTMPGGDARIVRTFVDTVKDAPSRSESELIATGTGLQPATGAPVAGQRLSKVVVNNAVKSVA